MRLDTKKRCPRTRRVTLKDYLGDLTLAKGLRTALRGRAAKDERGCRVAWSIAAHGLASDHVQVAAPTPMLATTFRCHARQLRRRNGHVGKVACGPRKRCVGGGRWGRARSIVRRGIEQCLRSHQAFNGRSGACRMSAGNSRAEAA